MSLLNNITYDDLTEDLKLIYDICGEEAVINLIKHYGGLSFYVPKITRFEGLIYRYIKENNHLTTKKLAAGLGVSEQFIKSIMKKHRGKS